MLKTSFPFIGLNTYIHTHTKQQRTGKDSIMKRFMVCTHKILFKSKRMRWAEHVARIGKRRRACRVLVGKLEGN